ncbi:unnamed protein product [Schistosoma turkestanicum]|nr:unnamed protein product [Schistosoma turkestanicum]
MIRKIVKFRRVNRARERIVSLVSDSITVQAMVLDSVSAEVDLLTYEALKNDGCSDSAQKALLLLLNCFLNKPNCTHSHINDLHAECTEPLSKLQSNVSKNGLEQYQEFSVFSRNLSLIEIISALVYTLSADDIIALDRALKFGREDYYSLMKNPSSLPKFINFQSDVLDLSSCVHSSSQRNKSTDKCNKYFDILDFHQFHPCSRYIVDLTCSLCGISRSKRIKHSSSLSNNDLLKAPVCCVDLLLAVCKAWRWKDLSPGDYLRRIGPCQFSEKQTNSKICLNPYHWSRVLHVQDKIHENVHCSNYSSDPDIVCLGLKHINNANYNNRECHLKESNADSEYSKNLAPLSTLSSSSSSSTESTSSETQISTSYMDRSYDSVISYDLITNNFAEPLLAKHDGCVKTKITNYSLQFLHKLQQNLHMDLSHSYSCLMKWEKLSNNTDFALSTHLVPSNGLNHNTSTTASTTMTSLSSSDELHDCHSIVSTINTIDLKNSNLHFNPLLLSSLHNNSVVLNTGKSCLHTDHCSPSSPSNLIKPWANISYWESHHHVGRRWYQITNRKLHIVYNDGDIIYDDDDDNGGRNVKNKSDSSLKVHIHNENYSNDKRKSQQNDCIYLSLLTLYQSNQVKYNYKSEFHRKNKLVNNSTVTSAITSHTNKINSNNNNHIIRSSSKQCRKCYHDMDSFNNNNPSVIPNLIVQSSLHNKSSSGWKQCCRLGNQGISLTLTPYGCVWLSNQALATNLPVFVSSPFLQLQNANVSSSSLLNGSTDEFLVDRPVYRVPAGCSLLVFDLSSSYESWLQQYSSSSSSASSSSSSSSFVSSSSSTSDRHYGGNNRHGDSNHLSNNDNNDHHKNNNMNFDELHKTHLLANSSDLCKNPIIHISLGKGWGPSYRRPDVTHCPARLEVWINLQHLFSLFIASK